MFASGSPELSVSFDDFLVSVSMVTLGVLNTGVVRATVGETVTLLAVLTMFSVLSCDVVVVVPEFDTVVTVGLGSFLVLGSNYNKKNLKTVPTIVTAHTFCAS